MFIINLKRNYYKGVIYDEYDRTITVISCMIQKNKNKSIFVWYKKIKTTKQLRFILV